MALWWLLAGLINEECVVIFRNDAGQLLGDVQEDFTLWKDCFEKTLNHNDINCKQAMKIFKSTTVRAVIHLLTK